MTPASSLRAGNITLAEATQATSAIEPASYQARSMGGRLIIHLDAAGREDEAERAGRRVVARIESWASRLTRHDSESELSRLNADPSPAVVVRPTLAAALKAGLRAGEAAEGLVDIAMLEARLAAERPAMAREGDRESRGDQAADAMLQRNLAAGTTGAWRVSSGRRGTAIVTRRPGLRFDLGGIGKGWIADRALYLLSGWPGALVDADGDLAVLCAPGRHWILGVGDPASDDRNLAVLRLAARTGGPPQRWGVATSGTSVHRWVLEGRVRHHLIDPRTGRPAETDVVQATVVAASALRAEALAKAAVIAGTAAGFALLERAGVAAAVLLTAKGETLALPGTLPLLVG